MSNLLLRSHLEDNASPALKLLKANVEAFSSALGEVSDSSTQTNAAIRKTVNTFREQLGSITDSIDSLSTLRVVSGFLIASFFALNAAITLSIHALVATVTVLVNLRGIFGTLVWAVQGFGAAVSFVVVPALGALTAAAAPLVARLAGLRNAVLAIGGVFALVSVKILLIAAAFAGVIAAGVAVRDHWETITSAIGDAITAFGKAVASVTTFLIPAFIKGFLGGILDYGKRVVSFFVDALGPAFTNLGKAVESIQTSEVAQEVKEFGIKIAESVPSVDKLSGALTDTGGAMKNFASNIVPTVITAFSGIGEAINTVTARLQVLSSFKFDSVFGDIKLSTASIVGLFQAVGAQIGLGTNLAKDEIAKNIGVLSAGAIDALVAAYQHLPEQVRPALASIITQLNDVGGKAQLTAAANDLFKAISIPENFAALNEGKLNEALELQFEAFKNVSARIIEEREKLHLKLGLIEETSAQRLARIQNRAALNQARQFTQASANLVRNNKKAAIALATVDAGLAITGAIKHGAGYGPAYLAFYVASVAASLASTISAIKSNSLPSGISTGSAPPQNTVPSQREAPPEIIINASGAFTAEELGSVIQRVRDAESGNSGQLPV